MRGRWHHRLRAGHLLAAAAAAVPLLVLVTLGDAPVDLTPEAHFWPVVVAAGTAAFVTRRVALLAARVAEELKLPACLRRDVAVGGLVHDVGKLSVPLDILQKPGPLEDAEFAEIRRHPDAGRQLLDELGGFPETRYDPAVVQALERIVTPADEGPSWVAGLTAPARGPVAHPVFRRAWPKKSAAARVTATESTHGRAVRRRSWTAER
jgi:hypothetical protein